jgi:hypothetical protein
MAKSVATKQALEKAPEQDLQKVPDVGDIQKILDSIPRFNDIKNLDRTEVVKMAAKDWFDNNIEGVGLITNSLIAAESFMTIIVTSAPYVQKWRDLMKINSSKAMQNSDRSKWAELGIKTFKSFGIVVPEGTTVPMNGKDVPVTKDDAVTWTKWCHVVWRKSPQVINGKIDTTRKALGTTYLPEPEHHPAPIPAIHPPAPPVQGGTMREVSLHIDEDGEVTVKEPEIETPDLLGKLGTRLGAAPAKVMMPVPSLKQGDVDAFIKFNQADSVVGAVPPMDAVFGGLEDFHLAKKVGELARKIVKEYGSDKSVLVVNVTHLKKQKVDESKSVPVCVYHPLAALDAKGLCPECNVFTEADEQV